MKLKIIKEVLIENIDLFLAYFFLPALLIAKYFKIIITPVTIYPILVTGILLIEIHTKKKKPNLILEYGKLFYKILCYISLVFALNHYSGERIFFYTASLSSLSATIFFTLYYLIKKKNGINTLQAFFYFSLHFVTFYIIGSVSMLY